MDIRESYPQSRRLGDGFILPSRIEGFYSGIGHGFREMLEPVQNLLNSNRRNANLTIFSVFSVLRSQFFHSLLHLSSQPKLRSTIEIFNVRKLSIKIIAFSSVTWITTDSFVLYLSTNKNSPPDNASMDVGIIYIYPNNTQGSQDLLTRAEAATVFVRLIGAINR